MRPTFLLLLAVAGVAGFAGVGRAAPRRAARAAAATLQLSEDRNYAVEAGAVAALAMAAKENADTDIDVSEATEAVKQLLETSEGQASWDELKAAAEAASIRAAEIKQEQARIEAEEAAERARVEAEAAAARRGAVAQEVAADVTATGIVTSEAALGFFGSLLAAGASVVGEGALAAVEVVGESGKDAVKARQARAERLAAESAALDAEVAKEKDKVRAPPLPTSPCSALLTTPWF